MAFDRKTISVLVAYSAGVLILLLAPGGAYAMTADEERALKAMHELRENAEQRGVRIYGAKAYYECQAQAAAAPPWRSDLVSSYCLRAHKVIDPTQFIHSAIPR